MADALVSIVLEKLGSIFLDGIEEEVRLIVSVRKEIKSLTNTLTIIQGVLEDADEKQIKNKAVKLWLEEFKEISYDAEDLLDEWRTMSLVPHMQQSNPVIKKSVHSKWFNLLSCSYCKPVIIRNDIGLRIKELNERLNGVYKNIQIYSLGKIQSNDVLQINGVLRIPTTATPDFSMIYGRDNEKNIFISKLLSESSTANLHVPVTSIIGTGGFGKTTLAQLILKDEKVVKSFDKLMWVCVSDHFLFENVAKEIIQQAQENIPDTIGWQALHKNLSECVKGKHFLLVLDDVWPCSSHEWSKLKSALNCGDARSRIIVTSRSERLAEMINSSYIHLLGQLSDENCWSLFKSIAFSGRESDIDTYEDIGRKFSKKCKGVPLATRVTASLMCYKTRKEEWHDVLVSNVWDVKKEEEGFLPSILRSYNALPSYLKPCLLYFAIFPKDAIIGKKEIIQLWMAHGYLGSDRNGSEDLEMKGRDYFDNLAMDSFLQDFQKDNEGNITGCKMHDLVHDFVQFLTKNETIILEEEKASYIKVRHLCAGDLGWSSIYQQKNLRTLLFFSTSTNRMGNGTLNPNLLHQLQCLRVLSLRGYQLKELPSEVEQLLQLRYLDLSDNSRLEILPETICNLFNLQTLKLKRCKSLTRLPEGIGKLSNLRHLEIEGCEFRPYYSQGCEFRTLDTFIVVVIDAHKIKEGCTFGDLKLLNNLDLVGHLKINGLGQVNDVSNAAEFELKKKDNILSLVLEFGWRQEKVDEVKRVEEILEALQPHTNLEKLVIKYYQGFRLPSWISSLSNLTVLTLMDLHCLQLQLPALGKLASLEFLHLHGLISVKSLGCDFYGLDDTLNRQVIFQKLKKLILSSMPSLEELDLAFQNGVNFFPNLSELIIRDFFPSLRKLRIGWLPRLLEFSGLGKLNSLETLEWSRMDVGYLADSLLPLLHDNHNNYPNLKNFKISDSSQSSLPKGFNLLTSIRQLVFHNCEFLDFMEDDLKHLTMLEQLKISYCPILAGRFSKGDISSSSSHYYKIFIRQEQRKPTQTDESSHSDLEKSYQSDANVYSGMFCHNCEMYPIDVMWNTPEVLNCYNTPSKHPDLANQRHTHGHPFEHISNCGNSSGPLHSDVTSEYAEGGLLVVKLSEIEELNNT